MRLILIAILTYICMAFFSYALVYSMQHASHSFAERFVGEGYSAKPYR